MPYTKVKDIKIYYEPHGDGFPFILILGLAGDVNWWNSKDIRCYASYFRTILFDNRGAGRSDKPRKDYTIKTLAEDVLGLLNGLKINKANILGTSMGGMIAQEIAINHPERVEKIILCSTHCGGTKKVNPSKEVLDMLTSSDQSLTEGVISLCFTNKIQEKYSDFIIEFKNQIQRTPINPKSYFLQLKAVNKFDSYSHLKNISVPTLILHGKEDKLVPCENALLLNKCIPDSKLIILDELGHWIFQPKNKKINEHIIEFLTS